MAEQNKKFLGALKGAVHEKPPFWMMRQAGRYLPEYREVRAKAGSFLNLAYNPELAAEVTLQPLRRFGMDAAILFSDILIVPHALGRDLRFMEGEGPKLNALRAGDDIPVFDPQNFSKTAQPVWDAVAHIRTQMKAEGFDDETALIGFAGSPWTVACYMVEGGSSRDFPNVLAWARNEPESFQTLIDVISDATIFYLSKQVENGAEALQLFDSWAGALNDEEFKLWSVAPTKKIVTALRQLHPHILVIGFPRLAGEKIASYVHETGVDGVSLDQSVSLDWAASKLQSSVCVQGNLDPDLLLTGGSAMDEAIAYIREKLSGGPFIFNLGHGINKGTPIENVERLVKMVRA